MKNYEFTRDLDGVAIGDVREMSLAEAIPLLDAGTVVETDKEVTIVTAPVAEPIEPITGAGMRANGSRPRPQTERAN
jgi:hypothetical protein